MINLVAEGVNTESKKFSVLTHFYVENKEVKVLKVLREFDGKEYIEVARKEESVGGMSLNDVIENVLTWTEESLNGSREI